MNAKYKVVKKEKPKYGILTKVSSAAYVKNNDLALKQNVYKIVAIYIVAFLFAAILYVSVVVSQTQLNMNIANLNKSITSTQIEVNTLNSTVNTNLDLASIEKYAASELGLVVNKSIQYMTLK